MGAGITPIVGRVEFLDFGGDVRQDADVTLADFLDVGYRYQPLNSGLVFRFIWTPAVTNEGFFPAWFGLSQGYGFK